MLSLISLVWRRKIPSRVEMYNPKYRKAKASFVKKFDPNLAETTRDMMLVV